MSQKVCLFDKLKNYRIALHRETELVLKNSNKKITIFKKTPDTKAFV